MPVIQTLDRSAKRPRLRGLIVFAVFVLTLIVLWVVWDWNWFKAPIERRVAAATGREFRIGGDLDVDFGFPPTIHASDVRFANAPWSKDPQMFTLDRIDVDIRFWPLLVGRVVLPSVALVKPRLVLERDEKRAANWDFDGADDTQKKPLELPSVGALTIEDGELVVRDPSLATNLRLDIRSGKPRDSDALAPLLLGGEGRYRNAPFKLDGRVESPLQLQDQDRPFRVDLTANAGTTQAHARGQVFSPMQFRDFDVQFALEGDDLADLYPLLGIALPQTPPYTLDGQLARDGLDWHYRKFAGTVGDSDLGGDVTVETGGARPKLIAQLVSKSLDFDDLAGFLGLPPSAEGGETASPQQQKERAQLATQDRVLPQQPYKLDKLRSMDADVHLDAAKVSAPPLPIDSLKGHLTLVDGLLKLEPLTLQAAGGRIESFVSLDASRDPIVTDAQITLRGLELPKLFPNTTLAENSVGRVGGRFALQGKGNSIAQMMGTSSGEVGAVMGKGKISNLLLELAGLDLQETVRFLLGRDKIVTVRCAYADFGVKDGVMDTRQFVFDTTDTVLYAEGQVNLRDEQFELTLKPKPKDKSLVSLRSPLRVGGSFKNPSILPKAGPLALRAAAAAALYAIAPPAILLALLETGPGEDSSCDVPASAGQQPADAPAN